MSFATTWRDLQSSLNKILGEPCWTFYLQSLCLHLPKLVDTMNLCPLPYKWTTSQVRKNLPTFLSFLFLGYKSSLYIRANQIGLSFPYVQYNDQPAFPHEILTVYSVGTFLCLALATTSNATSKHFIYDYEVFL